MAIDFPSSPAVGQRYAYAGINYVFTAQGIWSVTSLGGPATSTSNITTQVFTSGSGTYTPTAGTQFIEVQVVGGGGGGGGGYVNGGPGGAGGNTIFGPLTGNGGAGGLNGSGVAAVTAGGIATGGDVNIAGGAGSALTDLADAGHYASGANGGNSFFGGAGAGGYNKAGTDGAANSGSGGGGGSITSLSIVFAGCGGGAGGYARKIISSPTSYSYSVGAGGTAGTAVAGAFPGGAGGSGIIIVTEYNIAAAGPQGPMGLPGSVTGAPTPPQGRLTLQTLTPVMTATQAAKTTIYYTPYIGDRVPIYDGSSMVMTAFAELSAITTDTTKNPAAIGASKVNDWFVWNDAGTIRLSHGPDWLDDTTRFGGSGIIRINGIWMNAAIITNGPGAARGTYVGTTRSNASSTLDWIVGSIVANGGTANLYLWNAYNRVDVQAFVGDGTSSWSYATGAWAPANANQNTTGGNRVSWVAGLAEEAMLATHIQSSNSGNANAVIGIGYDSNTTIDARCATGTLGAVGYGNLISTNSRVSDVGVHFFQAVHRSQAAGTITWGGTTAGIYQTGMTVVSRM